MCEHSITNQLWAEVQDNRGLKYFAEKTEFRLKSSWRIKYSGKAAENASHTPL